MYEDWRNVYAKVFLLLEGAFLMLSDSLRDIMFHHLFWCFGNSSDPFTKKKLINKSAYQIKFQVQKNIIGCKGLYFGMWPLVLGVHHERAFIIFLVKILEISRYEQDTAQLAATGIKHAVTHSVLAILSWQLRKITAAHRSVLLCHVLAQLQVIYISLALPVVYQWPRFTLDYKSTFHLPFCGHSVTRAPVII